MVKAEEPTNHEIRIEFASNRHHDLLESMHIIAVAHAFCEPGYVDVSFPLSALFDHVFLEYTNFPIPGPAPQ